MPSNVLRNLPSVGELLENPRVRSLVDKVSHNVVVSRAKSLLDELRRELQTAAADVRLPSVTDLAERIAERVLGGEQSRLQPVINAGGDLLDDRLGGAPLADEAIAEMAALARDYTSLEIDLSTGGTAPREAAVEPLLRDLCAAEAASVVNHHEGAILLVLASLAAGKEVVVSRSHIVETASGYRLHDTAAMAGARLREVGTINRTRAADFAAAISDQTAAVLHVSTPENGAEQSADMVSLPELVALCQPRGVPVIVDAPTAALVDLSPHGCSNETLRDLLGAGAGLAIASGDRLIGGPACGIIVGRRALIEKASAHPLARPLRANKLGLAALLGTLRLYAGQDEATLTIPLARLLATPIENLKNRAHRLAPQIAAAASVAAATPLELPAGRDRAFATGPMPPSWCVAIEPANLSVEGFAARLRGGPPSVIAAVRADQVVLDLRTVFPRHDQSLVAAIEAIEPRQS